MSKTHKTKSAPEAPKQPAQKAPRCPTIDDQGQSRLSDRADSDALFVGRDFFAGKNNTPHDLWISLWWLPYLGWKCWPLAHQKDIYRQEYDRAVRMRAVRMREADPSLPSVRWFDDPSDGISWLRQWCIDAQAPAMPQVGGKQPWSDDDWDYMFLSDAIARLADGGITVKNASKQITESGPVRFMRKGRRCKVRMGDFRRWWQARPVTDAVIDRQLEEAEKRKAAEKAHGE